MAELIATTATLKRGITVKLLFVLLAAIDFLFTVLAVQLGFTEHNPVVARLLYSPSYLFLLKVVASFFLAWLVPSRLLLPSVGILSLVVAWDLKELVMFFS